MSSLFIGQSGAKYLLIWKISTPCGSSKDSVLLHFKPDLNCPDTLVDNRDGQKYPTILIGNQCWMKENLKVTHYRNGDPIPNVTDDAEWLDLESGAYCNYNNDELFSACLLRACCMSHRLYNLEVGLSKIKNYDRN